MKKSLLLWIFVTLILMSPLVFGALTDDIRLYYTFDTDDFSGNTVIDKAGNYNGTKSSVTTNTSGLINGSIFCDGSNSYVITPDPNMGGQQSGTISLWMRRSVTDSPDVIVEIGKNLAGVFGFGIDLDNGVNIRHKVADKDSATAYFQNSTSGSYNDGSWHHLVHIQDGANSMAYLYIDGSLILNTTTDSALHPSLEDLEICDGAYLTRRYKGEVDEFGLWNRSLSGSEVSELYNSGNGLQYPFTAPTPSACEPWNVSCFTDLNRDFNISTYENNVKAITFNNDGSKVYITGSQYDNIQEFNLTSNYDISTAVYNDVLDESARDTFPNGITFNPDGTYFYIFGSENDKLYTYYLSTPYSISSSSYVEESSVITSDALLSLRFNDDGHYIYLADRRNDRVLQYHLPTAYNVTSVSLEETYSYGTDLYSMDISTNGSYLYAIDGNAGLISQFELSDPFNISTSTYLQNLTVNASIDPIRFSDDGRSVTIGSQTTDILFDYGTIAPSFDFINYDPTNGTTILSNQLPYQLNFTFLYVSGESSFNCTLDFNGTDTVNTSFSVTNMTQQINYTFTNNLSFDKYSFTLNCSDASFSGQESKDLYLLFDDIEPAIMIYSPANNTVVTKNINELDVNISVYDENLLNTTINILYPNNSLYYTNESFNMSTTYNFTQTFNFDNETSGNYTLQLIAKDGHTKKDIDFSKWKISKSSAAIDFGNCKISTNQNLNDITYYDYSCEFDRCIWDYEFSKKVKDLEQYIECDEPIIYLEDSDYPGHLISGDNWIDAENDFNLTPDVIKITDYRYKYVYSQEIDKLKTKSIGELNTVEQNRTFIVEDLFIYTQDYEPNVIEKFPTNYNLTIGQISSVINITSVLFEWNNSYYSTSNPSTNFYEVELYMPYVSGEFENYEHSWVIFYNSTNFTIPAVNQSVYDYNISDSINSYINTHILNISVYDEVSGDPIFLDVGLNLIFDNGYDNVTISGTYTDNHSINFYMSPNSSIYDVPVNAYGQILLSGSYNNQTYIANTYTFNLADALSLSNNGTPYSLSVYAIGVGNSTTVTYNWKTSGYVDITGTMRIYRCNVNGSRSLVSSVPISQGLATANIELLTAQYSYDVIYNGVIYQQEDFYACHIESLTVRNYFIDISILEVNPAIGLYMIDCSLTYLGNNTYNMAWSTNPEDSSTITGCLLQTYTTITGQVENYRNCTNTSFSLQRVIPDLNNDYVISGELTQSGNIGYCRNDIGVKNSTNAGTRFGATLLFSLVLLFMGAVLIYAGETTKSLMAGVLVLVVAFFLGILALSWQIVATVIAILIMIGLLIRYNKNG